MEPIKESPCVAVAVSKDLRRVLAESFELIAAEVAHEVVYPLQFLRFLIHATQRGRATLDAELVAMCEDRLGRTAGFCRDNEVTTAAAGVGQAAINVLAVQLGQQPQGP